MLPQWQVVSAVAETVNRWLAQKAWHTRLSSSTAGYVLLSNGSNLEKQPSVLPRLSWAALDPLTWDGWGYGDGRGRGEQGLERMTTRTTKQGKGTYLIRADAVQGSVHVRGPQAHEHDEGMHQRGEEPRRPWRPWVPSLFWSWSGSWWRSCGSGIVSVPSSSGRRACGLSWLRWLRWLLLQ